MDIEFWEQRWLENQIGFHLNQVNPWLQKHWHELNLVKGNHVFVPLCGKSLDMLWLETSGYCVTGVECSQLAIESFLAENNLTSQRLAGQYLNTYKAGNIQLLHGDFFKLRQAMLANVAAVYDRAALIALPEALREGYVARLIEIVPAQAAIFLITLEYDQSIMSGPPFSVTETEVHRLYGKRYAICRRQQTDILQDEPRFARRGLQALLESVYLLKPK